MPSKSPSPHAPREAGASWFVPTGRRGAAWTAGPVTELLGLAPAALRRDARALARGVDARDAGALEQFLGAPPSRPVGATVRLGARAIALEATPVREGRRVKGRLFTARAASAGAGSVTDWQDELRLMVERLGVTIFRISSEGRHEWFGADAQGRANPALTIGSWRDAVTVGLDPSAHADVIAATERALAGEETIRRRLPLAPSSHDRLAIDVLSAAKVDAAGKVTGLVGVVVDATGQLRTETALADANARLEEAQRVARLGHWHWNVATNALSWSDEIYRIFGLDPASSPVTYPAFLASVHPDDRGLLDNAVMEALEGRPYDVRHRVVRPGGEVRVVHERGTVHRDASGRPERMLGTVQDVTEAADTERRLRRSEARLRTLFEQAPVGVVEFERGAGRLEGNAAFCRMVGLTAEDLRAMDPRGVLFDEDRASLDARLEGIFASQGTGAHIELRLRHADGSERWVRATLGRIAADAAERERYVAVVEDVTESRRARQELEAERRRADDLVRQLVARDRIIRESLDAIAIADADARFTFVNDAFLRLVGVKDEASVLGRTVHELHGDVEVVEAAFGALDQQGSYRGTLELRRPDGTRVWAENSVRLTRDDDGLPVAYAASLLDITSRVRAEAELRASEARFKAAFDRAPIGLAELALDLRWTRANDRFREIFSLGAGPLDAVDPRAFLPREDLARVAAAIGDGGPRELHVPERELRRADGRNVWCSLTTTLVAEPGVTPYLMLLVEDVTERRERALAEAEATRGMQGLLRQLVARERVIEGSLGAIVVADTTSRISYANAAFVKMWGLAGAEDAVGRLGTSFWSDPEGAARALGEITQTGRWTGSLKAVRADGTAFIAEVAGNLVRDDAGAPVAIVASFLDVTARVLAETKLRASEARFRGIAENVSYVVAILGADYSRVHYLNPAFETVWGRPRASMLGRPNAWSDAVHPEDRDRVLAAIATGAARQDENVRILRPDGSVRWMRIKTFPMGTPAGEVDRIVAVAEDITGEKAADDELQAAARTVARSLREKEVLLKEVHHRVKNNLQVISSLLSLQSRRVPEAARTPLQESRDRINSIALVHENLYRSDDLGAVDFAAYLRRLVESLREGFPLLGGRVGLEVEVTDVQLDVNHAIPCGLIVNELTTNALKYAFPAQETGTVRVAFRVAGGTATLRVEDDGAGLPAGFRPDAAAQTLGLTLVRMLAEQLCGELRLESEPGAGTRCVLDFPVTAPGGGR